MDICSLLQEVAILIIVYKITAAESDLLESLQPKLDNPPELNEFLTNVLEHRHDFNLVKDAARKYQKMKKEAQSMKVDDTLGSIMNPYNTLLKNKIEEKRHVPYYNVKRKFRNLGLLPPNMRKKFQRIRRGAQEILEDQLFSENDKKDTIKKRYPQIIMLQEVEDEPIQEKLEDDTVRKRQPLTKNEAAPKIKHHLPSQIFTEPQGESLDKRSPEKVVVQSEAESGEINIDDDIQKTPKEKKQALDLSSEVHHTYKSKGGKVMRDDMRGNQQGDVFYVDLQHAAEKENERNHEKKVFSGKLRRQGYYYPQYRTQMYNHPMEMQRPQSVDYPHYPNSHQQLDDDAGFEKALAYEVEPKYHNEQEMYNNPSGNSLYSVDAGRPENYQPFYPQMMYQPVYQSMGQNQYLPQNQMGITNEKFFIDSDDNMRRFQTTTTDTTTGHMQKSSDGKKTVEQVGKGFVEITKARRDDNIQVDKDQPVLEKKSLTYFDNEKLTDKDEELRKDTNDKQQSSVLSKHSLHPLRVKDTRLDEDDESMVPNKEIEDQDDALPEKRDLSNEIIEDEEHFQARNLKFIDYENANFYNQDENYEDLPPRSRRDFLDALGMKNEEEYAEDNPYSEEMNVNNTDVHNDTHIQSDTTHRSCKTTTHAPNHQKQDMKHIAKILEENMPKHTTPPPFSSCHYAVEPKRAKNNNMPITYLEDHGKIKGGRKSRNTNKDIETKIMQNKDKIYSGHDNRNHVQVRQEPNVNNKWSIEIPKLNLQKYVSLHKLNKKQDYESEETTATTETTEATSETTETNESTEVSAGTSNSTESEDGVNSEYEQIAHHMDLENEKLAQVVNGHLASKIVCFVFDLLTKKSSLKTKFSSGLSRKHVNFAGGAENNIFKSNETEDADEARLLLGQISKVLNKLVLNQVRRKLCQRLPEELKTYLEAIISVKTGEDDAAFVPNEQQGDFLFTYQDNKNVEPPFDIGKLQDILVKLEGLLIAYNNLNSDCQNRAEPVRDYIEKHVRMLKKIVNCPGNNCADKFAQAKRNINHLNNEILERQLESVGLGKDQEFIPNFDINQLVKNKMVSNGWKSNAKRDTENDKDFKSSKYKRLELAAEKIREKRENEKKIAEMFGSKQKRSLKKLDVDYEEPVVYSLG